jgi:glycosyltransferase involved in cell wall biosynthesis
MRILAITNMYPSADFPSQGVFVQEQVKGLCAVGLDVRVLFVDRRRDGPATYYRLRSKVRDAVTEFQPDVIHVMYGGVMAEQIIRHNHACPIVVTFRGSDLLGENLSGWKRKIISHYGVRCSRWAAKKADGVVVVARHLMGALNGAVPSQRLRVIPSGIDLSRFKPIDPIECKQKLGWSAEIFHVVFASSSGDPVKRPWLAKAAVEHAKRLGCPAEIHVVTGIPTTEMPVWLNAGDALLLTSLHEGSPNIIKEALACGLPVVSVDVGDVAEQLESQEGCHLSPADPEALAAKLHLVWQRGKRLDSWTRREDVSVLSVAQKLKQLYEELISPKEGYLKFATEFAPENQFSVPVVLRDPQKQSDVGVSSSIFQPR